MGDPERISRDDWETILHAPFQVYSLVAAADGEATEAQFRRLSEEIVMARGHFSDGTIGFTMAETLAANLDPFWAAYQASGRSPKDVLKRVKKALRKAPDGEAIAIRDWLLALAVRIGDARRGMGVDVISSNEAIAIRDLAGWLDRPVPAVPEG
ncbi:MAG: hypothetical protein AABZ33_09040 [Chloroflexota bacterium]